MDDLEADGIRSRITHHIYRSILQLLAVQQDLTGEGKSCIIGRYAKIIEGSKLYQILGGIAGNQITPAGAHQILSIHGNGIVGIL